MHIKLLINIKWRVGLRFAITIPQSARIYCVGFWERIAVNNLTETWIQPLTLLTS